MTRPAALLAAGLLLSTTPLLADGLDFALGKALFDRIWTPAPASTDATDGLGPLFNARSCATCHKAGGRGTFTQAEDGTIEGSGLVLRLGDAAGIPDPLYGSQLQTRSVQGLVPEGTVTRTKDGGLATHDLSLGPLGPGTHVGGRLAPSLLGTGLLERVDPDALIALADPEDNDGDGISGRINWIGEGIIGRFGWKAGQPSVLMQSAAALRLDVGLSSPPHPDPYGDCTDRQVECRAAPNGASMRFDNLEVDQTMLDLIVTYVAGLPAPAAPEKDEAGSALFAETGCAACHQPRLPLEEGTQIAAYTDLLLHDMGDGLADGIGEAQATGREWRTAPLWGLGSAVRFLHDGRAHSLSDALAHHGGEAAGARDAFFALSDEDRALLLSFLGSL